MASRSSIGALIRATREEKGLTGSEVAERLGCDQSRISKIERGNLKPSLIFIDDFARAIRLSKAERDELRALTEFFLIDFDRWRLAKEGRLPNVQQGIAQVERHTRFTRVFQWAAVPALLQEKRYTFSLLRSSRDIPDDQIERIVRDRKRRQSVLQSGDKRLSFIIAESALRMRFCDPDVMLHQLRHLRDVIKIHKENENLSITILPTDIVVPQVPLSGFAIFDQKLVMIETQTTCQLVWDVEGVQSYLNLFRSLDELASSGIELEKTIGRIERDLRKK